MIFPGRGEKRKTMKRTLLILLSVVMLVCLCAACGNSADPADTSDTSDPANTSDTQDPANTSVPAEDTSWEYIQTNGKLIVGLDDTFAPMGFRDESGTLVGFDIDLANAVGEILGVEIVFEPIDWTAKEFALSSKRVDCLWNGMSATPARQQEMALTDKYLNNILKVASFDSSINVQSVEDLADLNIGIQAASAALEVVMANEAYDTFKDNITEYPTYDEAILDMQAGRVDVIVVDQVLAEYKNTTLETPLVFSDFEFGDDFYAIGCRQGEKALAAKITDAIAQLIENGKAAEISNKWFGKNIVILEGYDE